MVGLGRLAALLVLCTAGPGLGGARGATPAKVGWCWSREEREKYRWNFIRKISSSSMTENKRLSWLKCV